MSGLTKKRLQERFYEEWAYEENVYNYLAQDSEAIRERRFKRMLAREGFLREVLQERDYKKRFLKKCLQEGLMKRCFTRVGLRRKGLKCGDPGYRSHTRKNI